MQGVKENTISHRECVFLWCNIEQSHRSKGDDLRIQFPSFILLSTRMAFWVLSNSSEICLQIGPVSGWLVDCSGRLWEDSVTPEQTVLPDRQQSERGNVNDVLRCLNEPFLQLSGSVKWDAACRGFHQRPLSPHLLSTQSSSNDGQTVWWRKWAFWCMPNFLPLRADDSLL